MRKKKPGRSGRDDRKIEAALTHGAQENVGCFGRDDRKRNSGGRGERDSA